MSLLLERSSLVSLSLSLSLTHSLTPSLPLSLSPSHTHTHPTHTHSLSSQTPHRQAEVPQLLVVYVSSVTMMAATVWNFQNKQMNMKRRSDPQAGYTSELFLPTEDCLDLLVIGVTLNHPAFSEEVPWIMRFESSF